MTCESSPEFKETAGFDLDHWQLNELEAITGYPLDYRVPRSLINKVDTIKEAEEYLNRIYCSSVGVEFEHILDEKERLWLYEHYEEVMHETFTPAEKVKMVQLLVRTEEMEKIL